MVHKRKFSEGELATFLEGYNYGLGSGRHSESFLPVNPYRVAGEEEGIKDYHKKESRMPKVQVVTTEKKIKALKAFLVQAKKV